MTTANGINPASESATASVLRRCAANVVIALKRLTRPARASLDRVFPWLHQPQRLAIAAAIALAVFIFGMVLIDAPVIRAVGHLPHFVVWFFDQITDYGKSGWFLWPLGLLFLALAALPRMLTPMSQQVLAAVMVRVGFLFVAIGAPSLFASIIKRFIGRARPGVGGSLNPYLFDPFHWTAAYAGSPSGHATTAFAVLAAFGSLWPRARTAFLIYALLIAASRMVVTAHYPTDVAAGALVGIVGVLMVRRWFALQRLGFAVQPDGQLRQFPGPSLKRIKAVARELLA
jgi:undecaprenyl-diphosphatase